MGTVSMYLKRLEIVGFKSFATKTVLEFLPPKENNFSITAVVGPNGSGKSNLVEAIRWTLGEQSLKSLRGKKSEDIIFSSHKTHLNLAEATLFFNNEDGSAPIEYKEFSITRRIYRHSEGEYLINNSRARLQDILVLLAKSNFGQKSYSIVGQGLVDQILQSSPFERKKFFDEATGVRQYQIKKEEALRKIEKSQENLQQASIALSEITPRLRSLTKQMNRLGKRQEIENELRQTQKNYYSGLWQDLNKQIIALKEKIDKKTKEQEFLERELKKINRESEILASEEDNQFQILQKNYQQLIGQKNQLLAVLSSLRANLIFEKEKTKRKEIQIFFNQEKLLADLNSLAQEQKKIVSEINNIEKTSTESASPPVDEHIVLNRKDWQKIKIWAEKISEKIHQCLKHFVKKEIDKNRSADNLVKSLEEKERYYQQEIEKLDKKINEINKEMESLGEKEKEKRKKLLNWQKNIQEKQSQLNKISYQNNELKIESARVETKKDVLENEIKIEMGEFNPESVKVEIKNDRPEEILAKINKLKYQMELIGGIDPEVTKEYPEVRQRYEFLSSQTDDLIKSLKSLNKIIEELNEKIKEQFKTAFSQINQEFDRYFKIIFGGGSAKIVLQQTKEELVDEENGQTKQEKIIEGIDILATPPGKKIKNIEALSGGERALASLALICAIISINKPPFVVFDEVDAALDQENSFRFAKIIKELRHNSQFIVITHNQQTIESADILYGVTMGNDGISRLISLKLE